MPLHIYCPTEKALIVCAVRDENGVFRLPVQSQELPGIEFKTSPGEPINPQIISQLAKTLGLEDVNRKIDIDQEVSLEMHFNNGDPCTVYVCHFNGESRQQFSEFPLFIDVLRAFPPNENRKSLLKAFQFFSVGHKQDISAISSDDLH